MPPSARGAALCLGVAVGCGRVCRCAVRRDLGRSHAGRVAFVSVLRTLALVLVFGLLRHLVRGGLEAARSAVSRHAALLGRHTALVVQRLAWLGDVLIGVVLLAVLLMTWQVYDNPAEAITGLLSVHATIGSQQLTIGLVLLALAALGARISPPGCSRPC